jgi:hypothetical protein
MEALLPLASPQARRAPSGFRPSRWRRVWLALEHAPPRWHSGGAGRPITAVTAITTFGGYPALPSGAYILHGPVRMTTRPEGIPWVLVIAVTAVTVRAQGSCKAADDVEPSFIGYARSAAPGLGRLRRQERPHGLPQRIAHQASHQSRWSVEPGDRRASFIFPACGARGTTARSPVWPPRAAWRARRRFARSRSGPRRTAPRTRRASRSSRAGAG